MCPAASGTAGTPAGCSAATAGCASVRGPVSAESGNEAAAGRGSTGDVFMVRTRTDGPTPLATDRQPAWGQMKGNAGRQKARGPGSTGPVSGPRRYRGGPLKGGFAEAKNP